MEYAAISQLSSSIIYTIVALVFSTGCGNNSTLTEHVHKDNWSQNNSYSNVQSKCTADVFTTNAAGFCVCLFLTSLTVGWSL